MPGIQPSLFDSIAHTRAGDPDTSYAAAETVDVKQKRLLTLQALAKLEAASGRGVPFTAAETHRMAQSIQYARNPNANQLGESTIRTRLTELYRLGYVELADHAGVTASGRHCARYTLNQQGRQALGDMDR